MAGNTGIGATLLFSGGISYTSRWRSVSGLGMFVDDLEDTALDSAGFFETVPDDLAQTDMIDIEVYFDGKKSVPLGTVGILTITFPLQAGQSTPFKISGSGYISREETPELAAGQRLIRNVQFKFDGKTGPTITLAT